MNSNFTPREPVAEPSWWRTLRLRDVAIGTIVVMLVVLGFALLLSIRTVLVALFLGVLLATALRPLVDRMRPRMPRWLACGAAVGLLLISAAIFMAIVVPVAFGQAETFIQDLPDLYDQTRQALIKSRFRIARQFGFQLPSSPSLGNEGDSEQLVLQILNLLPTIIFWIFGTLSVFLFTYYWLLYRERSLQGMLLLLPMRYRESALGMWLQIEEKIGAFLRGQALLALIMGIFSVIGYSLIGMPYALLLALAAATLELIPFIGPLIMTVIAGAIGFSVSVELGIGAVLVGIVAQQIENILLVPRIMDRAVGVSPVVTLLAVVGFGALFGIGGALLAIPLAAVAQVLFFTWVNRVMTPSPEELVAGRSSFARARYQAYDLMHDLQQHVRRDEGSALTSDPIEDDLEDVLSDLDAMLRRLDKETA